MAVLSTLTIKIAGDVTSLVESAKKTEGILDKLDKGVNGMGASFKRAGEIAGGFLAANVLAGAADKVTSFFGDSIGAMKESIAVGAQLNAVLASTKGVAGLTADEIKTMAGQMEKLSLFEDEAIISSSSLLLTFTKIGKDTFPRAQQAILDMAQAMKMDLQSATTMVGKALNDPVAGITAMSRAGIQFTEDQKKMIKSMVEAGDVAGAQALILGELETQFGGSAKAASDAAGQSEKYKDRMNDLKEMIGAKLLPVQELWLKAQVIALTFIADKLIPKLEELYAKHWPAVEKAIASVASFVQQNWPEISAVISFGVDFVKTKIEGMIEVIKAIIEIVTSVVSLVSALVHGDWSRAWSELKDIASASIDLLLGYIKTQFGNIPGIVLGLVGDAANAGLSLGKGLANGVIRGINSLLDRLSGTTLIPGISAPVIGQVTPSVKIPSLGNIPELARGHPFIPYDNYPALLHRGERVMTAAENRQMSSQPTIVNNYNTYVSGSILTERDITRIVRDAALRQEFRGVLASA